MDAPDNDDNPQCPPSSIMRTFPDDAQKLFVHAIELRPDTAGRKRLTLIVDFLPALR